MAEEYKTSDEAYDRWIEEADAGDPECCLIVSHMYRNGRNRDGKNIDLQKADEYLQKAVDANCPDALREMANMYEVQAFSCRTNEPGGREEYDEKLKLSHKFNLRAAKAGSWSGAAGVASDYQYGFSVRRSGKLAVRYYTLAEDLYEKEAKDNPYMTKTNGYICSTLAAIYEEGEIIPQNSEEAKKWRDRALEDKDYVKDMEERREERLKELDAKGKTIENDDEKTTKSYRVKNPESLKKPQKDDGKGGK